MTVSGTRHRSSGRPPPRVEKAAALQGEAFDDVLAAARTGADWAWERIYSELSGPVCGYLRGRGAEDPDDLTGEVFLQVVRDLRRFDGTAEQFRSWVFTIAHHRLLDAVRRRQRRPRERLEATEDLDPLLAPSETADTAVLAAEDRDLALAMLDDLTDDQREVLLLRVVAGLSVREVAAVMGKRNGAVKALQHRALRALNARYGDVPHPPSSAERSPS